MIGASVQRLGSLLTALSTRAWIGGNARRVNRPAPPAFDARARELLERAAGSHPVVAGSVHLVGIKEAREEMRAAWERVAALAPQIAEAVIRRNLGTGDTFARHDEETFILCFADADTGRAEARAQRIGDSIKRAILKAEPNAVDFSVEHFVARLDPPAVHPDDMPLVDAFATALRRVKAETEQQVQEWRQRLLREAFVLYSPLFDPEKRTPAFFRCLVDEQTGRSALVRLSNIASEAALREAIFELDCLLITRATVGLHDVVQSGGTARLLVPVTYQTLNNDRTRERYFALCADIPDAYRQYLLFELHGAPSSVPGARIVELASMAGRQGGGAVVEAHPNLGKLDDLGNTGLFGISLNAAGWSGGSEIATRLARGTTAAHAAKLRAIVYGAETQGIVEAAVKARVDLIGGKALGPAATEPRTAATFPLR